MQTTSFPGLPTVLLSVCKDGGRRISICILEAIEPWMMEGLGMRLEWRQTNKTTLSE